MIRIELYSSKKHSQQSPSPGIHGGGGFIFITSRQSPSPGIHGGGGFIFITPRQSPSPGIHGGGGFIFITSRQLPSPGIHGGGGIIFFPKSFSRRASLAFFSPPRTNEARRISTKKNTQTLFISSCLVCVGQREKVANVVEGKGVVCCVLCVVLFHLGHHF